MLQRLTVFAVNTGIWTAVFAFLTVILVCVVHDRSTIYPDRNTIAACLSEKRVLHHARCFDRLALL